MQLQWELLLEALRLVFDDIRTGLIVCHGDYERSEEEDQRGEQRDQDFGSQSDEEVVGCESEPRATEDVVPLVVLLAQVGLVDALAARPAPHCAAHQAHHLVVAVALKRMAEALRACVRQPNAAEHASGSLGQLYGTSVLLAHG